ncbi:MAG: 16S rRNA (uracil(1498)-N(3))-methyltransferase [Aestuariibacter sp.]
MRIPRIYHPELLHVDQMVTLSKDASNHVINVLRLKNEHPVVLFNGDGNEYSAELQIIGKRQAEALVLSKLSISVESSLEIHLGQGISKGDRMDFVIQKAVELGVTEITPLITERCVVKLNQERWQKKSQQWQKIAISACEQCGRNFLPTIHSPMPLQEWMQQSTRQLRLTLNPKADKRLLQLNLPRDGVRLLIGPEGGLSDSEVYQSEQNGFHDVSLGPRVLRTETAALATLAILQAQFGDL